ncbi:MAG: PilC/PilY family type IV pilus protein [Pseudomonadales bacterium]
MKMFKNKFLWVSFVTASLAVNSSAVVAAPGDLASSPLFLSTAVQPNILFMIDDSGSMGWDNTLNNGTYSPGNARVTSITNPTGNGDDSAKRRDRWLTCRGYNVMAYDPAVTYTPWKGVDSGGNAYTDRALTNARSNAYQAWTTVDISNHIYFPWTDADADGLYDGPGSISSGAAADAGVGAGGTDECGNVASNANGVTVSGLTTAQKTNYANWYTYYRSRHLVAKKALAEILFDSTARVGLGTLWNRNGVGTPIADVDNITNPVPAGAPTPNPQSNKDTLMKKLFEVGHSGGTPLIPALDSAGRYFMGSSPGGTLFGGANPGTPILPLANGGSCQQNFTILMSDGFWNSYDRNNPNPAIGNTDGDGSSPWDGGAYADTYAHTLADVAMKYYETDLAPTFPADVPAIQGVDTNNQQHMVTYTVAFGVNGTLPAGPAVGAASFTWPLPVANTTTTIDDMRHAAYNGRGQFLSAGDPDTLISSLDAAITDIQTREGTAAAVSFNSSIIGSGTQVYQANFNSAGWHGNLRAFGLSAGGVLTSAWDAASKLDARDLVSKPRQIVTYNGTKGVPFAWPASYVTPNANTEMSGTQIADLLVNAPTPLAVGTSTTHGQNLVKYLRGDAVNEGAVAGKFRLRNGHRLGDIVHSSPVFVGAPNIQFPDDIEGPSNLYSTFKTTWKNRAGITYIGANDGMLHAFDTSPLPSTTAGDEVFAYMPGLVFSAASGAGLHALAEQAYNHRYYVDLSPSVADVFINGAWKTVLLGGLRGGGKGIFALDITNPASLKESTAAAVPLWEFTHADLGDTFSEIQFARLANDKWAAIFGNGYNNEGDGTAKLFIVYLDGSLPPVIIPTGAGKLVNSSCNDAGSDCNGLSTPVLADLNGDVNIDRVYAGDLQGNMWAFDLSDPSPSNWAVASQDLSGNPMPVFQACTSATCVSGGKAVNRQPITAKPTVTRHPRKNSLITAPNVMVYFGTGQYLTTTDNSSSAQQSYYGVWDGGTYGLSARTTPLKRADLVTQVHTEVPAGIGTRTGTSYTVNYDPSAVNTEYGWMIDLADSKERSVVNTTVLGSVLFFNTLVPSSASCSGGGYGWRMFVDTLTGGEPGFPLFDLDNDGDFSNDTVISGSKTVGIPAATTFIDLDKNKSLGITAGSKGNLIIDPSNTHPGDRRRRISWTHLEYE